MVSSQFYPELYININIIYVHLRLLVGGRMSVPNIMWTFSNEKVQFQKDFYLLKLNRIYVRYICWSSSSSSHVGILLEMWILLFSFSLSPGVCMYLFCVLCTTEMVKNQVKLLKFDTRFNSTYNSDMQYEWVCEWASKSHTLVVFFS